MFCERLFVSNNNKTNILENRRANMFYDDITAECVVVYKTEIKILFKNLSSSFFYTRNEFKGK